jgi:DNA-nicking Smr family endonuclease
MQSAEPGQHSVQPMQDALEAYMRAPRAQQKLLHARLAPDPKPSVPKPSVTQPSVPKPSLPKSGASLPGSNPPGARAVHHFSDSKNGEKLALNYKISAQPRFQGNETRTRAVAPVAEVSGHKTIRRGRLQIDGQIDLHGLRQVEAQRALAQFLRRVQDAGGRCVLVVTGKGRSVEGVEDFITPQPGVIRRRLPEWLNQDGVRHMVAGYASANARHGGTGAYYVVLKRS